MLSVYTCCWCTYLYLIVVGFASGQESASPVLSRVSDTVTFSWVIPQGGLGSDASFHAVNPNGTSVFFIPSSGVFTPFENYKERVTFQGNLTSKNITFTMTNIQTSDAGIYTCLGGGATINKCGQMLIVLRKPKIQDVPVASPTPVFNKTVTLKCRASSDSLPLSHGLTLTYSWQRDGSDVTPASGSQYKFTVSSRETHNYSCRARESQGLESDWSPVYNMVPEYGPYQISLTPSTLPDTVIENQDTISPITCSATCRPECNYRWFKDGTTNAGTDATLSLGQAVKATTGYYRCQSNNTHGDDYSSTVSVDVLYKASIENFTANSISGSVTVNESTPVTLTCRVDSNPRSTLRLMNGSQELKEEANSLTASTIVRPNCRRRGNYSCTATNNIGTVADSVVKLAVTCYPRVDETSNVQEMYGSSVGDNVTVSVPVLAYPVPTFTWRRNSSTSQDLSGSSTHVSDIITNSVLQLTRIQQEDLGEYTLTAENGVGDPAVFTVSIVPQGPPEIPTNLTVRPDGPTSLVVAWKIEFNGGAEQTFTVEYSKDKVTWTVAGTYVESKDTIYQQQIISDLQPFTTYFVKVISRNEFGEKKYTESVSGHTAQAIGVTSAGPSSAVIGGVVGGVTILIVMAVLVVVTVVILRRKKEQNHHDGDLCDTSEDKVEMTENDLYVGGEDLDRGSSAAVNMGDVYAIPDKKNKGKEKESKATNMGDIYAIPDKKNKGKEKESKATNMGDIYAIPDKKNKGKEKESKATNMGDIYAIPDKKNKGKEKESKEKKDKKKGKKGLAEDKKQANPRRNRGDIYEDATPGQYGARANKGFEGEDHAASSNEDQRFGRNEDGLMYVKIDFGNQKPSQEIHRTEERTEYAGIAFGKVGAPLPDDDEETTK